MQGSRPEVFVPESVDNSYQGATGGDDYEPLVGVGSLGVVDVHVLATLQNSFVNAIQANGIRVGLSEYKAHAKLGPIFLLSGRVLFHMTSVR